MKLFKNPFFYTTVFSLSLLGLIIGSYVFGWTTTTQDPPGGNVVLSSGALPSGEPGYVQFASSSTAFGGDAGLFWDNTNKRLGIGTTTPGVLLNMWGANATLRIQASSANQQAGIQLYDTTTQAWNIYKTADANNDLQFYSNTGGGMVMTVKGSSGNVGIGTTGPDAKAKLHVMGNDVGGTNVINDANDRPTIQVEGNYPNVIIKSKGNASHSSVLGFWVFDGTNTKQWNMGVGQNGLFSMGYCTNESNPHCGLNDYTVASKLAITTDGNVGIGTTTPAAALHVVGTGKFGGVLDMTTQKITNLATPTAAADAATKGYVDALPGPSYCYVRWGLTTCASGWTLDYAGYIAAFIGSPGNANGMYSFGGPWCHYSTLAASTCGSCGYYATTKDGYYTVLNQTRCAVCCK